MISKIAAVLRGEPVAVATAIGAGFELALAIQAHHITEGVVTALVLAVAGLLARSRVTPTD